MGGVKKMELAKNPHLGVLFSGHTERVTQEETAKRAVKSDKD